MAHPLIVFDLDGTLVDSLPDIAEAMNALLREEGLPPRPLDEYRRIAGDGARVAVLRAARDLIPDERIHDRTTRYLDLYRSLPAPRTSPYDGIPAMLDALLASPSPPRLGVLTNKPHDIATSLVRRLFPDIRFCAVEGVREGWPRKPDPTGLLRIIDSAGADNGSAIYVGDTDTDMKAGKAAGIFTIGCAWGFRDEDELTAHDADAIAHHPSDLVSIARERLPAPRARPR